MLILSNKLGKSLKLGWICNFSSVFFFSLLFIILVIPTLSSAKTNRKNEKQRIEQGIQTYKININKLKDGIAGQQLMISASEHKQRNLLDELALLDNTLSEQLKKLQALELQIEEQEVLIATKESALQKLTESKQNVQQHLQKRIKAYYKMGEIGIANVAFATESMPVMLKFRDSFSALIDYDKTLINDYRQSINQLQQAKSTLTLEKGILHDFSTLIEKEQLTTNTIKLEKESFFEQINTQKELHQQAVKEMEQVSDSLSTSLNALKQKAQLFDKGFLVDKGKHPAPLSGTVIARFGEKRKNRLGISGKSTGITVITKNSSKVRSIFEGKVRYASYLYGYGNTVIIDHGYQYFSIISRLDKLFVKKGDTVEQGDTIALTGDLATLMDDGIFIEIRHGSKPLDPFKWLDTSNFNMQ